MKSSPEKVRVMINHDGIPLGCLHRGKWVFTLFSVASSRDGVVSGPHAFSDTLINPGNHCSLCALGTTEANYTCPSRCSPASSLATQATVRAAHFREPVTEHVQPSFSSERVIQFRSFFRLCILMQTKIFFPFQSAAAANAFAAVAKD